MTAPARATLAVLAALVLVAGDGRAAAFAGAAGAGSSTAPKAALRGVVTLDTALFAGGCFWCIETAFESQPGVAMVISGYSGGTKRNPTYEQVGHGGTGHAEAIQVSFDPKQTSYEALLDLFWHNIDPTDGGGQFCDRGDQYRSAIFWSTEAQRKAALASKKELAASGVLRGKPIVTEIVKAGPFWPAEEYHQDFWKKDPDRYFSYRKGCGRDERLRQLWGDEAGHSLAY